MILSPGSGWVGWGGVSSISLSFSLTSKSLLTGVSLVVANQQELGIGVGLLSFTGVTNQLLSSRPPWQELSFVRVQQISGQNLWC